MAPLTRHLTTPSPPHLDQPESISCACMASGMPVAACACARSDELHISPRARAHRIRSHVRRPRYTLAARAIRHGERGRPHSNRQAMRSIAHTAAYHASDEITESIQR
jgi:hypothetical protein